MPTSPETGKLRADSEEGIGGAVAGWRGSNHSTSRLQTLSWAEVAHTFNPGTGEAEAASL